MPQPAVIAARYLPNYLPFADMGSDHHLRITTTGYDSPTHMHRRLAPATSRAPFWLDPPARSRWVGFQTPVPAFTWTWQATCRTPPPIWRASA